MFSNYIKIALRNILKNKLYAAINIIGLAVGLSIYLFSNILAEYELNHDRNFSNHERIYTVASVFSADANIGVRSTNTVYAAFTPLMKASVPELDGMARTIGREYLMTMGEDSYYDRIKFADRDLTNIFDFEYISGGPEALDDPSALILFEKTAQKYFGDADPIGQVISLDHTYDFHVAAVIKTPPVNSHFMSDIMMGGDELAAFASIEFLNRIDERKPDEDWGNMSGGNATYIMIPENRDRAWLTDQLQIQYETHYEEDRREFIVGLELTELKEVNTYIWKMIGMPIISTIKILALAVLIVACVNYTNLATAQSFGRSREVGLRKTMGADRKQLLGQFLTESLTIAAIAMALAIALLEVIIPVFNGASGKVVSIDYLTILPWLLATTTLVGILAGAYPAYLITSAKPIEALNESQTKGTKGNWFRSTMIGVQFFLTIFLMSIVLVMFFQNQKVKDSSLIFPKDQVLVLERLDVDGITSKLETLRNELKAIPGVAEVTYASQVPFEQSDSAWGVSRVKGDVDAEMVINRSSIDHDFIRTYNIPLVAGRDFDRANSSDLQKKDVRRANVIINQLAVRRLGFDSPSDALGQSFFSMPGEKEPFQFDIIGVMEDQNMKGLHNKIKPWLFKVDEADKYYGSVLISDGDIAGKIEAIEAVWKRVIPEYPIQHRLLDDVFQDVYKFYKGMNAALTAFAGVALMLALIGLFGLAAFMAEQRTKEIGIRKVYGAGLGQIIRLMVWQFSRPVVVALVLAVPASYFASGIYLDFFDNRIGMPVGIILGAGVFAILLAWSIIAVHAFRIARLNPIMALRYE